MISAKLPGLPIIKKTFQAFLQYFINATPNFRYGCVLLFVCFLMGLSGTLRDFFAPTSSEIFTLQLWKLVTGPLIEPNIFIFAWSVISLYQFIVYIEPSWGYIEILKYVGIVQLLTTVAVAVLALFSFVCLHTLNFFFHVPICGLPTIGITALISLKQFLPDTVVVTTPFGRLKNGHLPLSAFFVTLLLWLFGILRGGVPLQVAMGLQLAWTYLRFFRASGSIPLAVQSSSETENQNFVVGDESEHFAWATIFPRRTQPLAAAIGNGVFRILVALKICERLKDLDLNRIDNALQSTYVAAAGVFDGRDAERKRQKALRVLNEKLSSVVSSKPTTAPQPLALNTSASSPRLPSLFSTVRSSLPLRRDSSTDEGMNASNSNFDNGDTTLGTGSRVQNNQDVGATLATDSLSNQHYFNDSNRTSAKEMLTGMGVPSPGLTAANINEHLYGVASTSSMASLVNETPGKPTKLLARMDSESTDAFSEKDDIRREHFQRTLESSEEDEESKSIK